jgi:glucokinase
MRKSDHAVTSETMRLQTGDTSVLLQNSEATQKPGYVAAVDIGGTNLRMALTDMSGNILTRWSSSTVGLREPEIVIHRIYEGAREMLLQIAAPSDALKSIAIGVPGVTDIDNGIVIATSYLMGWQNVPLRAFVEKELKIPAAVDNDVNLAAIGESWLGAANGVQDFVFLAIGTGIGAGIVLNGQPYHGKRWSAGEIGYMLVPGTTGGPEKNGEPGALESIIGGEGIKMQWQELLSKEKTAMPKNLNATEIFDRALDGNAQAQTILQRSATMLAQAIYNISLVLNCPLFVLGGSVGMHPALCEATQNVLDRLNLCERFRLVRSALGADAQLIGAIRVALETIDEYVTPPHIHTNSN